MDIGDLELLYHLIDRHDLLVSLRVPAEEREEVQECFWEVSFLQVLAH